MEMSESAPSNELKTWLFNPFHYIAGGRALGIGLIVMLIASLAGAATKFHFDGVIDLHSGTQAPKWVFVSENLINWLVMGVLLSCAGRLISRSRIRPLDVFGTQALARTPMGIMLFCVLLPGFRRVSEHLAAQLTQGGDHLQSDPLRACTHVLHTGPNARHGRLRSGRHSGAVADCLDSPIDVPCFRRRL